MRGGAVAARRAHNPKVAGSNPAPAIKKALCKCLFVLKECGIRTQTHDAQVMSLIVQCKGNCFDCIHLKIIKGHFDVLKNPSRCSLTFSTNLQLIAAMNPCPVVGF